MPFVFAKECYGTEVRHIRQSNRLMAKWHPYSKYSAARPVNYNTNWFDRLGVQCDVATGPSISGKFKSEGYYEELMLCDGCGLLNDKQKSEVLWYKTIRAMHDVAVMAIQSLPPKTVHKVPTPFSFYTKREYASFKRCKTVDMEEVQNDLKRWLSHVPGGVADDGLTVEEAMVAAGCDPCNIPVDAPALPSVEDACKPVPQPTVLPAAAPEARNASSSSRKRPRRKPAPKKKCVAAVTETSPAMSTATTVSVNGAEKAADGPPRRASPPPDDVYYIDRMVLDVSLDGEWYDWFTDAADYPRFEGCDGIGGGLLSVTPPAVGDDGPFDGIDLWARPVDMVVGST